MSTLSYIISLFEASLETSGDFTFSAADVGHYCYEFTGANVLTLLDIKKSAGISAVPGNGYVQYTAGSILYHASVACCADNSSGTLQGSEFEGNEIAYSNHAAHPRYGTADILTEGWMPSALTDYLLYVVAPADIGGATGVHGSVLILWS